LDLIGVVFKQAQEGVLGGSRKEAVRTQFVCQNCGMASPKWMGRCPECGAWNSFVEERVEKAHRRAASEREWIVAPLPLDQVQTGPRLRVSTGMGELDRVLGGGFVPGSVVLLGGQPGIGKSTLLLQCSAAVSASGKRVLYASGEESEEQIKLRADRLGITGPNIQLLSAQALEAILAAVELVNPELVVVDSIQTVTRAEFDSAPGSVTQVRECAHAIAEMAKRRRIPTVLVGHVTKEGFLAGPKVLEHAVDALLLFEGDTQHPYRILRATKNRFGSTDEIGVFEMTGAGLQQVPNPSEFFLAERSTAVPGSLITCLIQGSRPLLIEVQALTTVTHYSVPQRTCTGFDPRRLAMLLAVLERRAGVKTGSHDVFLNVAGGIRIAEPGADLAVAAAVASSAKNRPVGQDVVAFGEVGLAGEVRRVQYAQRRIQEALRLGFGRVVAPRLLTERLEPEEASRVFQVGSLAEALELLLT